MATRIDQAPNGRKTVLCDITGLGFTRMGNVLDQYTATHVSDDVLDLLDDIDRLHEAQRLSGRASCKDCRMPLY